MLTRIIPDDVWYGFGARSGTLQPMSTEALAADAQAQSSPVAGNTASSSAPAEQNPAPQTVPDSFALNGPRSDLAGGWGVRVRMGLLSDGSYGVERYTSTGVRQVPTWS